MSKALDSIATDAGRRRESLTGRGWSGSSGMRRRRGRGWAAGDSAGGLALARAAADSEEVTDKHPVTPGELLPARELEGDMLLLAGRYAEAGSAYKGTLAREPNRARSLFGVARAAELAGDREAAAAGYREFLGLMASADGNRPELATARKYLKTFSSY